MMCAQQPHSPFPGPATMLRPDPWQAAAPPAIGALRHETSTQALGQSFATPAPSLGFTGLQPPSLSPSFLPPPPGQSPTPWPTSTNIGTPAVSSPAPVQASGVQLPRRGPGKSLPAIPGVMPSVSPAVHPSALPVLQNFMSRIGGVVSEMERELTQDSESCDSVEGEGMVDWLDKQILAIEQRQEVCENRQKLLSGVRRIVADEHSVRVADAAVGMVNGKDKMLSGQLHVERIAHSPKSVDNSRLALLEADSKILRQQMSDRIKERSEELAIQNTLETERHRSLMLQQRLSEAEAMAERERHFGEEVSEARASAEADLAKLEESSRTVLNDCRLLQVKVADLEIGFENERRELHDKLRACEEESRHGGRHQQRAVELERELHKLVGEHQSEHKTHMARIRELEADLGTARTAADENHQLHHVRVAELEELVGNYRKDDDYHSCKHKADQDRIEELEKLLEGHTLNLEKEKQDHQAKTSRVSELEADVDRCNKEHDIHRTRIAELEQLLQESQGVLNDHKHQQSKHIARITELETELSGTEERHAMQHSTHKNRIAQLEDSLRIAEDTHQQQHGKHRARISELEEQCRTCELREDSHKCQAELHKGKLSKVESELDELRLQLQVAQRNHHDVRIRELEGLLQEARSSEQKHHRSSQTHRQRIIDLEQRVKEAEEAEEGHHRQHSQHRSRITELEQCLVEADDKDANHTRQHTQHRTRIGDLERELADLQAAHDSHVRHNGTLRQKITELEASLADMQLGHDHRSREHSLHLSKIGELEGTLAELRSSEERHLQQHSTFRNRIGELEQQLVEMQASDGNHQRQHHANQMKIMDLEQRLMATETSEEKHRTQHHKHRQSFLDLQQELDSLRFAEGRQNVHKARVLELEQLLRDAEATEEVHKQKHGHHLSRIAELEQQMEELRGAEHKYKMMDNTHKERISHLEQLLQEGHYIKQHTALKKQIEELETQLDDLQRTDRRTISNLEGQLESEKQQTKQFRLRAEELDMQMEALKTSENTLQREIHSNRNTIMELELSMQSHERRKQQTNNAMNELDQRVQQLNRELNDEQKRGESLREEVASFQRAAREMEHDAQKAVETKDIAWAQKEGEWQERLKLAEARINFLESGTTGVSDAVSAHDFDSTRQDAVGSQKRSSLRSRNSLVGDLGFRRRLVGELLPLSTDAFVVKVRRSTQEAAREMENANNVHVLAVQEQLATMLQARREGQNLRDSVHDYRERKRIVDEQRAVASNVEAWLHDLRALLEEIPLQHDLPAEEREELKQRLEMDIGKCEAELKLLQSPSSLSSLPEAFLAMLIDLHEQGRISEAQTAWESGLSPMHRATQHSRRDIIEYLLRLPGGQGLLNVRDGGGRTPLYYAQATGAVALEHWLREEAGATAPMHHRDRRPSVSNIPSAYLQLLEQIETTGWNSVTWRNGFTMLHWAASKGHADLCRYLMELDANPLMQDKQNRTPIDIANNAGHAYVAIILNEKMSH